MRNTKMLVALLAGLITLSLAGCGADKAENISSDPASTERGITATATDNASEPTAESSLPADTESKTEATAEKEKAESTATLESGTTAENRKPAGSADKAETVPPTQAPKQSEAPKPAVEKPQTPAPAEKPEAPAETPTANEVARKTAEKINALRQSQGSPAATILPGLGKVATYRSEQLITATKSKRK